MQQQQAILLFLRFKYPLENCRDVQVKLEHTIRRWNEPVLHGHKSIGYVIVTNETTQALVDRLAPVIASLSAIEQYHCFSVVEDVVSYNSADPFPSRVRDAYEEIRQRPNAENMRSIQSRDVLSFFGVKDANRSTAIKMGLKPRKWDKPQNPQ